jgi:site-specific recombinase XerD
MPNIPAISDRSLSSAFSRELPKYFTRQEASTIIYTHVPERLDNKRRLLRYKQRFLCWFLWNTGARITEARNMLVSDIEPYTGVIQIQTKKRKSHIRTIPKDFSFFQQIQAYILITEIRNKKDRLFNMADRTARRWVEAVCARNKILDERAHPHTFRHSFAINCLMQGTPLPVIQQWLGHADISKTMIYLKVIAKDTRIHMNKVKF